ncbi:isocitrate lyase/malate synthase [Myriangium duriaei CBS 260.36]|uniref:Isocitrate lyase/malate synthase n=1 Tax=Myriangium duriaei CBS 260.36 TaxID=1168546 RepID=A0A9P4J8H2_9PEZI|nr:isocitrate lyase/malate synthase [Myriangium duriaei CBS 260.36]
MAITKSDSVPYPFKFDVQLAQNTNKKGVTTDVSLTLPDVRGRIPSLQASRLRTMMLQAHRDPTKILAHACTYDGLSSRLVEEAGFPMVFLAGYAVASSYGLPDTGYIAMSEVCDKIRDAVRQTSVPVMADGDTGYGSPMNVKRTVESFAAAGAAGVMIEDQTWPKRCGHTKGNSVVPRGEAYARVQAAVDARNEGLDIFVLARTDALIHGWDEAMTRAKEFKRIGVDAIFVEALPDREAMQQCVKELDIPCFANIIEGGKTENLSAAALAELGFCAVAYPWTLVAAHLKAVREALNELKKSMTVGPPPMILTYHQVCEGVGFNKYWDLEERYKFNEDRLIGQTVTNGTNGTFHKDTEFTA